MKSVLSVLVGFAVMSMAGCGLLDDECASDAGEIRVASADGDFYIDKYEASRANATSATMGTGVTAACNMAATVPWGNVTYEDAKNACLDAGKRLCTREEWMAACGANYPYGSSYQKGVCNDGGTESSVSGGHSGCLTSSGIYDMSGNLREWVEGGILMGGGYLSGSTELTCNSGKTISDPLSYSPSQADGFRCCRDVSILS